MKSFNYVITDPIGIHARPAGLLVELAKGCPAEITIKANGKSAKAKKLIQIMSLGAKQGTELEIEVNGEGEEETCAKVEEFFKANL